MLTGLAKPASWNATIVGQNGIANEYKGKLFDVDSIRDVKHIVLVNSVWFYLSGYFCPSLFFESN